MKNTLVLVLALIGVSCFPQTQTEMNQEAHEAYQQTDKELNTVYQDILVQYSTDTVFIKNLKASQRIWITFRDAELDMKYPNDPEKNYGSVLPMCRAYYLMELTEQRTKKLRVWLNGVLEGDVCAGSVKTN